MEEKHWPLIVAIIILLMLLYRCRNGKPRRARYMRKVSNNSPDTATVVEVPEEVELPVVDSNPNTNTPQQGLCGFVEYNGETYEFCQ